MAKKKKTGAKKSVKRVKAKKTAAKRRVIKKAIRNKRAAARKGKRVLKEVKAVALEKIGEVTHYFPQVKAAAVLVSKDGLKLGDKIHVKGHTTDFKEKVTSIQLDRVPIESAKKGQEIGLLVKSRVRIGDSVYRI